MEDQVTGLPVNCLELRSLPWRLDTGRPQYGKGGIVSNEQYKIIGLFSRE
jgi:hypothetical protein